MTNFLRKIRDKHALWFKGTVFLISVAICVWALPQQQDHTVRGFEELSQWPYGNLAAQVDFSVHKSNAEIDAELREKRAEEIPYFSRSKEVQSRIHDQVLLSNDLSATSKTRLLNFLDSVYAGGVYEEGKAEVYTERLFVVNGNEVMQARFSKLTPLDVLKRRLEVDFPEALPFLEKNSLLRANLFYDRALTAQLYGELSRESIFPYKNKVAKGDLLVHKNEAMTEELRNVIRSYNEELAKTEGTHFSYLQWLGKFLVCVLVLGIMMLFLSFFRKGIFSQNTHVTFIFMIIVGIVVVTGWLHATYLYAVPFCLVPILIRVFFDSRTALFSFLNVLLLCSFFAEDRFQFIFVQLVTGIGTIFSIADVGRRSQLLVSAMVTFLFYALSFAAYHLVNETTSLLLDPGNYLPFLVSSICVLFAFPLIFLFEKLFGFISDFTMLELSDLNLPLLRELSQKVPGTFQHSLQVANLAEEAAYKIGGNPLLVRVGAMYHDIGKMDNPRYFTENQVGEVSPHEELSPEESAHIIIGHVIRGIERAREHKLPEQIIDFIRTHHGTTTTRFFLHNYKKVHAGEVVNEDLFRYPGPIPFSKETAILMMADSVEAASRSLKKYDAVMIDELVDKIIDHQISENQFINADITFRDINQVKKIFKKRLMNMYHVRIEYPR